MTRKDWLREVLIVGSRVTLAVVFLWAAWHKLLDPRDFALQVATYQILPLELVNMQALILPMVETVCGVLLLAGFLTRAAALVTVGMNVMFIVAIAIALGNDLHLQCGCFASSTAGDEMSGSLIVRDVVFLALGLVIVGLGPGRIALDGRLGRRSHA